VKEEVKEEDGSTEDNVVRADAASDRGGEGVNTAAVVKDAGEEKEPCLQQKDPKPTLNLL
nr:hypothetical protein [Tanacetum cinerariifolium]